MAAKKKAPKRSKSKPATKKSAGKKQTSRKKPAAKKATTKSKRSSSRRTFLARKPSVRSSARAGDTQGISRRERSDSESVEELLDEGNTFEADVVSGVEAAEDAAEQEVHTHEVPEDDVPGEYLDKD